MAYQRKRARPGYGQPFQDSRGYWNIQIANGQKRGRTVYKRIRCKTLEGLKAKQADFETKRARGLRTGSGVPTFAGFLREWIDLTVVSRNRYRTHQGYQQIVETYLIPWLDPRETKPIDTVEKKHAQSMINELAKGDKKRKPLAPRTLRNIRACLRRALNVAIEDGYLTRNIAKGVEVPQEPTIHHRTLSPQEAQHLLWVAEDEWYEALYATALYMGFREGELCGMRLEDLDIDRGFIFPRFGLQRQKGKGLVLVELKTEASREPLKIPPPLIVILRDHLSRLSEARTQSSWTETGMLFPNSKGRRLEPSNLARRFENLCIRAGFSDITFHSLRHTCGTLLAEIGTHPRIIQAILRHASFTTTAKYYLHARDQVQAEAIGNLGDLLADTVLELPAPKVRA